MGPNVVRRVSERWADVKIRDCVTHPLAEKYGTTEGALIRILRHAGERRSFAPWTGESPVPTRGVQTLTFGREPEGRFPWP